MSWQESFNGICSSCGNVGYERFADTSLLRCGGCKIVWPYTDSEAYRAYFNRDYESPEPELVCTKKPEAILNEIAEVLEVRGYFGMANADGIASILDELEGLR